MANTEVMSAVTSQRTHQPCLAPVGSGAAGPSPGGSGLASPGVAGRRPGGASFRTDPHPRSAASNRQIGGADHSGTFVKHAASKENVLGAKVQR